MCIRDRGGGIGYEAGAAIGGPIIEDKLGFRVSGWFKRGAGWVDRVNAATGATVDKDSNTSESIVVRGAVTIKPTEDLEITPSLAYQDVDQDDTTQFWGYLSNPRDGRFRNGNPIAQPDSDRFILPGLKMEWTLGDVTLISNTVDEEGESEGTPHKWAQAVLDAKQGDDKSVVMLSILNTEAQWGPSDRIGTLVKLFPYHHLEDALVADYGPAFSKTASLVETACAGFTPPPG